MVQYEDDCVGCDWGSCSGCCYSHKLPHLYCDECKEEFEILYSYNDYQLCADCLRKSDDFDFNEYGDEIPIDPRDYPQINYYNVSEWE